VIAAQERDDDEEQERRLQAAEQHEDAEDQQRDERRRVDPALGPEAAVAQQVDLELVGGDAAEEQPLEEPAEVEGRVIGQEFVTGMVALFSPAPPCR
jgi:hypothetical protein